MDPLKSIQGTHPAPRPAPRKTAAKADRSPNVDPDDIVRLYLDQMGQFKLLTREEEMELWRRIKEGDQVEDAKRQMIEANLRLVVWAAKKYKNRGLHLLDLIQEGNKGLMHALEKWNYPIKFWDLAKSWILKYIKLTLYDDSRTVRLPEHIYVRLNRMNRISVLFLAEHHRFPTAEEIAKIMYPADQKAPRRKVSKEKWAVAHVRSLMEINKQEFIPTRHSVREDESFGDLLQDTDEDDPLTTQLFNERTEKINEAFKKLTPRERAILEFRFGMKDGEERKPKEIEKILKISRQRVEQIQKIALEKLKRHLQAYSNEA